MRPTWRLAGAVGLWLVLEWYGATSEVSWLFLLAAWLLALLVACGAYALWNRAGLKLHLALERSRPAADSPVEELPGGLARRRNRGGHSRFLEYTSHGTGDPLSSSG